MIYLEAGDDKTVLACMEEGLRHGSLGAVVADVARLSMTASRRLHLAAKTSGSTGIALRRWRRQADVKRFRPTHGGDDALAGLRFAFDLAFPVPGVGRARWLVELTALARAKVFIWNWRHAMTRVISLFLPMWPMDRLQRQDGHRLRIGHSF